MKKVSSLIALSLLLTPVVAGCASDDQSTEEQTEEVQVDANATLGEKVAKFNEYASQNPAYFDFDSSVVKDNNLVKGYVAAMNELGTDVKYTINGYCDSRGSVDYNNALGMRRADSVKVALKNKGINNKMEIKTISYGKNKFQNYYKDFKKNQQANRKVEIVAEINK